MRMLLEVGPDFHRTIAELGDMGGAVADAADRGLQTGGEIAAGIVKRDYLSGQSLKRRTGNLANAVTSWSEAMLHQVIGVPANTVVEKYRWLLGDDDMTITPKQSAFLAIPIGEGLTASGVARYESPRQVEGGFFVRTHGRLLFGIKRGKRGKFRPLFTLVKSVLVQGSGALYDGVSDSLDDVTQCMQTEIDKTIGA